LIIGLEPLLLYSSLVVAVAALVLLLTWVTGGRHRARARDEVFESGLIPTGGARLRFPIKFYLIALFFLLFDLEVAFVLIWAYVYHDVGWWGFWNISLFIGVLLAGLVYPWLKGVLDLVPSHQRSK
jgi:NADH-quinone oxidoreductase subunit A